MACSSRLSGSPGFFLAVLLLLFSMGCATVPEKKAPEEPAPVGELKAPATLKAESIVQLKNSSMKGRAKIFAKTPDMFRIEVTGPFGVPLYRVVSDGRLVSITSEGKTKVHEAGSPFYKLPLVPEEFTDILLGSRAFIGRDDYETSLDENSEIERATKFKDKEPVLTTRFGDYRSISGKRVPFSIELEGLDKSLSIRHISVSVDERMDESVFEPSRPEDGSLDEGDFPDVME